MTNRNKMIFGGIGAAVLIVATALWFFGFVPGTDKALLRLIKDRPDLVTVFNEATRKEKQAGAEKSDKLVVLLLGSAQDYKTLGELINDEQKQKLFFKKSLDIYEWGIEKYGSKNIIFYLNGGKIAERLGDLEKAESFYKNRK